MPGVGHSDLAGATQRPARGTSPAEAKTPERRSTPGERPVNAQPVAVDAGSGTTRFSIAPMRSISIRTTWPSFR